MLSSKEAKCGIASYTLDLNKPLSKLVDLRYEAFPGGGRLNEWKPLALKLRAEADLVHVQYHPQFCGYWRTPALAGVFCDFLKTLDVPIVLTAHDLLDEDFYDPKGSPFKIFFQRKMLPAFFRHTSQGRFLKGGFLTPATHFIAHWKKTEAGLRELGIAEEKITVLYPGLPACDAVSAQPSEFLKGRRAIGMLGFLREDKGYDLMLHVLAQLPKDVILLAIGEPAGGNHCYLDKLKVLAASLGLEDRFVVTGYLPDANTLALLSGCRMIALPYNYRHHTASYALSYAIAARRPVLVSDMAYFKEVGTLSSSLRFYDRKDPKSLLAAAREMLDHPEAINYAADPFYREWAWEAVAVKTLKIYEKLLAERGK